MNDDVSQSVLTGVRWLEATLKEDSRVLAQISATTPHKDLAAALTSICVGLLVGSPGDPLDHLALVRTWLDPNAQTTSRTASGKA